MTNLSPAAQAVLTAVQATLPDYMLTDRTAGCFAAAALEAAIDQVVPEGEAERSPCREHCVIGGASNRIRSQFLAIAAELGAQP